MCLVPGGADAGRNLLARSPDVIKAILLGEPNADFLARNGKLLVAVVANRDSGDVLHKPGELAAHLGIPVGEPDRIVVAQSALRYEIPQQDGLVLAEPVTPRRLYGTEAGRDDRVTYLHFPGLAPHDEPAVTDDT